jgi:phage shock protein C
MFCTRCGTELNDAVKFCSECGSSTGRFPAGAARPRLSRAMQDAKIAGVCAGFARYFGLDVTLMRVIWVVLTLCPLPLGGVIAYIVAWIVMPKDYTPVTADQMHPANGSAT